MKFANGCAQFSAFEQRRFGVPEVVATTDEDSFLYYNPAKAAITLQVENHAALENVGQTPVNEAAHVQHAAHALGFLSTMAEASRAYADSMMAERHAYFPESAGYHL